MRLKTKAHNIISLGTALVRRSCPFCGATHMRKDGTEYRCEICGCSFNDMERNFLSDMRKK